MVGFIRVDGDAPTARKNSRGQGDRKPVLECGTAKIERVTCILLFIYQAAVTGRRCTPPPCQAALVRSSRCLRHCMKPIRPAMHNVPMIIRNAAAATVGLIFSRMLENICRARVRWFGPATNRVSTTSSREVAKANTAPVDDAGLEGRQGHAPEDAQRRSAQTACALSIRWVDALERAGDTDHHEGNAQDRMCDDDAEICARKTEPHDRASACRRRARRPEPPSGAGTSVRSGWPREDPLRMPKRGQRAEKGRKQRCPAADDQAVDDASAATTRPCAVR